MATTLNNRTAAREGPVYQMVSYVAGRVTLSGADVVVKLGTLPAGCIIIGISSRVITAVTGGTPVLAVGSVAAGSAAPAFPLTSTNILQNTMSEAAGSELVFPDTNLAQPLATDRDVYAGTSGGSTAGDAVVTVLFVKPLA